MRRINPKKHKEARRKRPEPVDFVGVTEKIPFWWNGYISIPLSLMSEDEARPKGFIIRRFQVTKLVKKNLMGAII